MGMTGNPIKIFFGPSPLIYIEMLHLLQLSLICQLSQNVYLKPDRSPFIVKRFMKAAFIFGKLNSKLRLLQIRHCDMKLTLMSEETRK